MEVTLKEAITFKSSDLKVGQVIEVSERDAAQLIAAGHAEQIADPVPVPATKKEAKNV
jgi:hypothetical protein